MTCIKIFHLILLNQEITFYEYLTHLDTVSFIAYQSKNLFESAQLISVYVDFAIQFFYFLYC